MRKILIVEDDRELNQGISYALGQGGYLAIPAYSIQEAQELYTKEGADLVLLDVNLPDGEGFEFCRFLRGKSETPVMFLTARDLEEDVLKGYELGADDYITKPFSIHVLRKKIDVILRRLEDVYKRQMLDGINEETSAEIRVGEGVEGFVTELWTMLPNVVTISITSPSGERTRQISIRQGDRYNLRFAFEKTEVSVEYRLLLENNDSQLIFLRFQNPVPGMWQINVEPVQIAEGDFHIWLPIQEFLSGEVYFLESNPDTTLTEPGTSRSAMTVAYYNGRENGVDINSGRGYTRDGLVKPDFAAPGVMVTGAGLNGRFVTKSGSSISAGITAGAVALLMEWLLNEPGARGVNSSQIRSIILLGVNQRPSMEYPNKEWGYGTLDLYRALDTLRRI